MGLFAVTVLYAEYQYSLYAYAAAENALPHINNKDAVGCHVLVRAFFEVAGFSRIPSLLLYRGSNIVLCMFCVMLVMPSVE